MFGLMTQSQHNKVVADLQQQILTNQRGFAAALAIVNGGLTVDELREKTIDRQQQVDAVGAGLDTQIAALEQQLAQLRKQRAHTVTVSNDLAAVIAALPQGVVVQLDDLVVQLGQPVEEQTTELAPANDI